LGTDNGMDFSLPDEEAEAFLAAEAENANVVMEDAEPIAPQTGSSPALVAPAPEDPPALCRSKRFQVEAVV
jgi:hypothetical protein